MNDGPLRGARFFCASRLLVLPDGNVRFDQADCLSARRQ